MNYIQLTIRAGEKEQETLIGLLSSLEATGFEQQDEALLVYFEEGNFPSYEVKKCLETFSYDMATVQEQNWNEVWETAFEPVVIDDFCAIRAHFHEPIAGMEHEIIITPKMSFGTGHHATTYLMIRQMREIHFKEKEVFDFGTGTGILAILAEKRGAATVEAIDVDDWSFENATENAAQNGCTKINFALTSLLPQQKTFDIVLANINRNVIMQYLPQLKGILAEKGTLLLSGLLLDDRNDVVAACEAQQFTLKSEEERNNWIALRFEKGR